MGKTFFECKVVRPFMDGRPPLGRVYWTSMAFLLLVACLYSFPWTTIMDESGVR